VDAGRRAVGDALAAARAGGATRLTVALTAASAGRADPLAGRELAERVAAARHEDVAAALRQHLAAPRTRLVVVGDDRAALEAAWAAVDPAWGAAAGWTVVPEAEVFR
jgi:hypothetical protein